MMMTLGFTSTALPTQYEYYTDGGIQSGLSADQNHFTLNGKNITLYSGAMHYFRTPKDLWRDRLRKMRAAGLNAVETYVPWNLHEPEPGIFDFGNGGTDMQDFLDIEKFLKTAQEEDLLAIVRPGPFICAEWEFGGFPSWLLREKNIKLRTSDTNYMKHVTRFFNALLTILATLQFTRGGPIIALQVENEYGSTTTADFTPDKEYLKQLRQIMLNNNINELLFTSDGVVDFGTNGTLPEYFLITANFDGSPQEPFDALQRLQTNRPKMAMEYYPGWFDHWTEEHNTRNRYKVMANLELILKYPGSFNLYVMHGGTSFGFMNGANLKNGYTNNSDFQPDTTSYDYDAPLTEAGDYTNKYQALKKLLEKYVNPKTKLPDEVKLIPRVVYDDIRVEHHIAAKDIIDRYPIRINNEALLPMELLPINNNSGQSYGYIVYRKENINLKANSVLTIEGHVCDTVLVLINGKLVSPLLNTSDDLDKFGFWRLENSSLTLTKEDLKNATLDLVVENWGRVNYGKLKVFRQFKGLWQGDVYINRKKITDWQHVPLEFKKSWTNSLDSWRNVGDNAAPGLFKGILNLTGEIRDTYVDMRNWTKGIVIVNGFVLGRYARIGPQQCLYLPAPLLKNGTNEFVVFEHYKNSDKITFSKDQIYETPNSMTYI